MSKMCKSHTTLPEYRLDGLDESAALKVLEFFYTSAISVDENNVWPILAVATKLGCQEIVDLCSELLKANLDLSSCVGIHLMAAAMDCDDVMFATGKFIAENIDKVCVSDKFLCLSCEEFLELVSSLSIVKENQLLELARAWLDYDVVGRKTTVLTLTEKFSSWAVCLNKYKEANLPTDLPWSIMINTTSDHAREAETNDGWLSSVEDEKSLEKEVPLHVCFFCGEAFDGNSQLCQHVLECSESAHSNPRVIDSPSKLSIGESVSPCVANDDIEPKEDLLTTHRLDQGQEINEYLPVVFRQAFDKEDKNHEGCCSCHHKICCCISANAHPKCLEDIKHGQMANSQLIKKSSDALHSRRYKLSSKFDKTLAEELSKNRHNEDKNRESFCEVSKSDCPCLASCDKDKKLAESIINKKSCSRTTETIENMKNSSSSFDIVGQNCNKEVEKISNDKTVKQNFGQVNSDMKTSTGTCYQKIVDPLPLSQGKVNNVKTLKRKFPVLKFKCLVCSHVFNDKMTLLSHKINVHGVGEDILLKSSFISSEHFGISDEKKHKIKQTTNVNMNGHNINRCDFEKKKLFNSQLNVSGDSTAKTNLHSFNQSYLNSFDDWFLEQGQNLCQICGKYHTEDCPCSQIIFISKSPKNVITKEAIKNGFENGILHDTKTTLNFAESLLDMSKGCKASPNANSNVFLHAPLDLSYNSLVTAEGSVPVSPVKSFKFLSKRYQHSDSLAPSQLISNPVTTLHDKKETYEAPLNLGSDSDVNGSSPESNLLTLSGKKKFSSRPGFSCAVCQRVFTYQAALFTHMKTHTLTSQAFKCQLCKQSFNNAPDLKIHVCPNGVEKPYECPSCDQAFAKNIHLKRHLATHSGLKPYPCWICGKRFSRSDHLKRHAQSLHAGSRPHGCLICGKDFVRKYELNKHMISHGQDNSEYRISHCQESSEHRISHNQDASVHISHSQDSSEHMILHSQDNTEHQVVSQNVNNSEH